MFEVLKNAWKLPDLRRKLLFTLLIVVLYRIGAQINVPFVDSSALQTYMNQFGDTILGYMNMLSSNAFSHATLFALSITPYITSSIIMQLLTIAVPALERLQKEGGDEGKKKITQITRVLTIVLGIITGTGYYFMLRNLGMLFKTDLFSAIVIITCYSAGSGLIMWLGEKINENGIGNGISIILFANIVSRLPSVFIKAITDIYNEGQFSVMELVKYVLILAAAIAIVVFVVFISNAERRLPVQYAKRVVGRKMYGGQSTHLPIKINMSGVMPIIFASSLVSMPALIIQFVNSNPAVGTITYYLKGFFSTTGAFYSILEFILIVLFSYFYVAISFNPIEVANNLKKNGGFIPGLRPGKPTSDFISKILNKLTFMGGIFLGLIAILPLVFNAATGGALSIVTFGGTSILIIIGVAQETTKEIEGQIMMRHYKGFLT